MKLSEIVAEIKSLKETITSFIGDKTKATSEALGGFSAKLTNLESGAIAELSAKTGDLATAQERSVSLTTQLEKAQSEVNTLGGLLKSACAAMKLDIKEGASSADMISAMQGGVASTLAKLNVPNGAVPAGKPAGQGGSSNTGTKMGRKDFEALTPDAKNQFFRSGGKLTE